jgi:type IV secretory pathway TrbD component
MEAGARRLVPSRGAREILMIVYSSLTRPKLRRGADWRLTFLNGVLALMICLAALLSHYWPIVIVAAILWWPGQWLLQQAGKHDPEWVAVYARALRRPLVREPNSNPAHRESIPSPVLPRRARWLP